MLPSTGLKTLALLPIAAFALLACDRPSKPVSITVSAIEKTPPPEAGGWSAKVVSSKTTGEKAHVDVVADALSAAKAKGPIRCTFMEGGEPTGLRFDRSDGAKVWVHGVRGVAQAGDCYTVDAPNIEKLRTLAKTLGVSEPPSPP